MNISTFPFDLANKNQEELFELITAYQRAINVNIISSITDTEGRILYANDRFCEVSKYTQDELIGKNHRIVNSGLHSKAFFHVMWETIKGGKPWHGELQNRARDGTFYWVDTVILPVTNREGTIVQYLSLRTLINDKKQAEKERNEYTEKLNEMLHITSHKIRGPLTRFLGIINLIEYKILNEEEFAMLIDHLKSSALEINDFTKELTDYLYLLEEKYKHAKEITG